MRVILAQDIHRLGKTGDVVTVKDGYARNYLLPQKKAFRATPENIRRIEKQKQRLKQEYEEQKAAAQELAARLGKVSVTITVEVNDLEKMYGSVTEGDIAEALAQEGYEIDRKSILLEKPITELGIYEVPVKVHPEVTAQVRVWVAKK